MTYKHDDPEFERYRRNYPKFPGVRTSVDLVRRKNVTGGYLEAVLGDLRNHAHSHVRELLAAFQSETEERVRRLILAEIAEIKAPIALPIFVKVLTDADEDIRVWAARGLYRLDTPEARKALSDAQSHSWSNEAESLRFQCMLKEVSQWK